MNELDDLGAYRDERDDTAARAVGYAYHRLRKLLERTRPSKRAKTAAR